MRYILLFITILLLASCKNDPVPKPKAYLRLDYPEAKYKTYNDDTLPLHFDKNTLATKVAVNKLTSSTESFAVTVQYPQLKGTIFLTYKAVENNEEHLLEFLRDAQNFTQKHTVKADEITEQPYEDSLRKVYGMLYEVGGNAASQSQFYVTDSINHFLTGSLYFYAKPNYDSILPAAHYLQKDIRHIMETVEWEAASSPELKKATGI